MRRGVEEEQEERRGGEQQQGQGKAVQGAHRQCPLMAIALTCLFRAQRDLIHLDSPHGSHLYSLGIQSPLKLIRNFINLRI